MSGCLVCVCEGRGKLDLAVDSRLADQVPVWGALWVLPGWHNTGVETMPFGRGEWLGTKPHYHPD